jgi:hypothetical protein
MKVNEELGESERCHRRRKDSVKANNNNKGEVVPVLN